MREHITISVESARITSFFFFSKRHVSLFHPNLLAWAFLPSRRSPLSKCSLCRARTGLGNVTEQRTHHSWQMHQLREQLLGSSLTPSSQGCARRGADAAVSKREKCIFPPQKEAVYRPSKKKKLISLSFQRWLRAHWEDAACVWSRTFVPASALLCLQSPCSEPARRTGLPWCVGRVPEREVQSAVYKTWNTTPLGRAQKCCFCWSVKNCFTVTVQCLGHFCSKVIQKTIKQNQKINLIT